MMILEIIIFYMVRLGGRGEVTCSVKRGGSVDEYKQYSLIKGEVVVRKVSGETMTFVISRKH